MNRRRYSTAGQKLHRTVLGFSLLVAVVVLSAGVAAGQEDPYNPGPPRISIADPTVCAGEDVPISISDGPPGESVTVSLDGQDFPLVLDQDGNGTITLSTDGLAPGEYQVVVTSPTGGSSSAPLFVLGEECEPGTPTISIADPSVCPGDTSAVSVSDGEPNENVTVSFAGQTFPLTLDENGNGGLTLDTTGLEPGDYEVSVAATAGTATTPLVILGDECDEEPPTEPEDPALTVTGSDVCVGDTLVATVAGAGSGDLVTVSLAGNSAAATAGPEGSVQAAVTTSGAAAGTHALMATSASGLGASTQVAILPEDDESCADDVGGVQVSAPQPDSEQSGSSLGSLARTGATIAIPTLLGVGLLALGVVLVRRARRSVSS